MYNYYYEDDETWTTTYSSEDDYHGPTNSTNVPTTEQRLKNLWQGRRRQIRNKYRTQEVKPTEEEVPYWFEQNRRAEIAEWKLTQRLCNEALALKLKNNKIHSLSKLYRHASSSFKRRRGR